MKKSIGLWQLFGFAFTSLLGTLLHFLYEWLGEAIWIAPISGVNESTWEHMKLLFWPMFIFSVFQSLFFRDVEKFWRIKARGIILGLITIPVLFYTYNGAIAKSPNWLNIVIFFLAAAIVFLYETRLFNSEKLHTGSEKAAIGVLVVIAFLFVIFTFRTPEFEIFRDPLSGSFGICS